jgi:MFS family permease
MIGFVKSILSKIYGDRFDLGDNTLLLNPMTFAGTALGMLLFGFTSDHWSRKGSLLVSTVIIVIFAILQTASSGAGGTMETMVLALVIYRFFLGIGIGGEYPAGSVGAAEHTAGLKEGTRNRWFIWFSNVAIDMGFVLAPLVALIVVCLTLRVRYGSDPLQVAITKEGDGLNVAWRVCLGTGVLPPLVMFALRLKLHEPEPFVKESMTFGRTPWYLILRFYWQRILLVSTVWFMYDFCSYAFYLFQGDMLKNVYPDTKGPSNLKTSFGWEVVIAMFYLPGCIGGSYLADMPSIGPKKLLVGSLVAQGIVGFILAAVAPSLLTPHAVGGFVFLFGLFLALGELGPGDTIGLFASKTSATAVR